MIESVEIKNFKSIKQKHFHLRNLNVLLGLNGMGKSSFIHNLLAFRQSKDIANSRLELNGKFVKIGTTKDALYQYSKKMPFATSFKFSNIGAFDFVFDYKIEADFFTAKNINLDPSFVNLILKPQFGRESLFNKNFQYLNANRTEPKTINQKNYTQVVELKNLGNHGEFTAHFIETYGNEDIEIDDLTHPDSKIRDEILNEEIVVKTLINQINLWMGEISPNVNIRTTSISSENILLEYTFKQPNMGNTNRFKPENVGFGITYGLPVVVAILKSKPGDLLIIENPESHIHPKGQAQLGRLMALAAMNGVQVIVETHSDHIVNGIRVAVKEGSIDSDKAMIYYFEKVIKPDEQYSKITDIEIDKKGELSEYPKDMLDEWSNQLFKLM
jgi:predicted ATPase